MKSRIINKKLKRDILLILWIRSMKDLENVIMTFPDAESEDDRFRLAQKMWQYDWDEGEKRVKKLGFRNRDLHRFYNKHWNI